MVKYTKYAGEDVIDKIYALILVIWREECTPKCCEIIHILKNGYNLEYSDHRRIALLDGTYKVRYLIPCTDNG